MILIYYDDSRGFARLEKDHGLGLVCYLVFYGLKVLNGRSNPKFDIRFSIRVLGLVEDHLYALFYGILFYGILFYGILMWEFKG